MFFLFLTSISSFHWLSWVLSCGFKIYTWVLCVCVVVAINFRLIPMGLREFLHLNSLNKSLNKISKLEVQRSDVSYTHVGPITCWGGRCFISKGNTGYCYQKEGRMEAGKPLNNTCVLLHIQYTSLSLSFFICEMATIIPTQGVIWRTNLAIDINVSWIIKCCTKIREYSHSCIPHMI